MNGEGAGNMTLSTVADIVTAFATVATAALALWLAFRPREIPLHIRLDWTRSASQPEVFNLVISPPFDGFGEITRLRVIGPYAVAPMEQTRRSGAGELLWDHGEWSRDIPMRVRFQPNANSGHAHFWLRPHEHGDWSRPAWALVTVQMTSPSPRRITKRIRIDTTH